jgi:hypothetical protein
MRSGLRLIDEGELVGGHRRLRGRWAGELSLLFVAALFPTPAAAQRTGDYTPPTFKGAEIISDWVPRSIEAIEKAMAEPGLLQRYAEMRIAN